MSIVLRDGNPGNYVIDDCSIHKYENVCSYSYTHCKAELSINLSTDNELNNDDVHIYFVFDCPAYDALMHWVVECFIFVPIFIKLKETYPNIKILTSNTKRYIVNIFKFFNITNEIVHTIDNKTANICFFSPIISMNDLSYLTDVYSKYIKLYIENISLKIPNGSYYNSNSPTNKVLFLPRNSKDNYKPNDRIIHGTEDIEQNIIDNGGVVLNTYQINNLFIQWGIVMNSDVIIVDFGSSFLFNCLFLKNKKIIVLNNHGFFYHHNNVPGQKILHDIIFQNNIVHIIGPIDGTTTITYKDIVEYIN